MKEVLEAGEPAQQQAFRELAGPPQPMPFRLAYRNEGEFVRCYFAQEHTMANAMLLGTIRVGLLSGEECDAWKAFQAAMQAGVRDSMRQAGWNPETWWSRPAPEHEK